MTERVVQGGDHPQPNFSIGKIRAEPVIGQSILVADPAPDDSLDDFAIGSVEEAIGESPGRAGVSAR